MNRLHLPARLPAETTPLVLHVDRLRSAPPPPRSRAWTIVDDVLDGALWVILGAAATVILAALVLAGIAAIGPGSGG